MSPATKTLDLIRTAFPGRDRLIGQAFKESRSFRELCEDYRRCMSALARWRRVGDDASTARSREYEQLLAELAEELQCWTEALEDGTGRPDGVDSR